MTRPRTPAERHERELDRMAPGGDYDASAPVRRQEPKGKVVPRRPSDETPMPVVEGVGAPGDSGDLSDAEHDHPFALSDTAAAKVAPTGAGSAGIGSLPARPDHVHGLDLSALTPQPITDDPGAPGATGEVPDAGHSHHFDPVAAGIPAWDVDATPDTLGLRSATGTMSVAPPSAPAHAIPNSETSVPPTADTVGRRTAEGTLEVANATTGLQAVNLQTGDGRYASLTALADHEAAEGEGVHGATSSSTGVSQIMARNADGEVFISATTPGASTSVLSRQMGDGRYLEMSTGANPQVIGNRVRTPAGTAAAPGLEVGEAGLGLIADTLNNILTMVTDGTARTHLSGAGLRPVTAGLPLGISSARWGDVSSDGVIETTAAPTSGPAIHALNGAIEGTDFVTDGSLFADGAAFGMRSAQHVAVAGGTGVGEGIVQGVKSGGNLRVQVESGLSYQPVAASSFDVNSDARRKVLVEGEERDHLADVLATPTDRFRRIEQVPIRPEGADERTPPTEIREVLGEEQLGWMAHNLTPDVAVLMGNDAEGWEVGYAVEQQLAKLWHAFRQSHLDHAERLDALESR